MERPRGPEAQRAELRAIVEAVDRQIAKLRATAHAGGAGITGDCPAVSWAELMEVLALGSAPELRRCPLCHHLGMRAATLCGCCWTKLPPLPPPGGRQDEPA